MIPTSPISVSTSPSSSNSTRPRNGSVTTSTRHAREDEHERRGDLPGELDPAPSSRQSSIAPTAVMTRRAAEDARHRRRHRQEEQRGDEHGGEDRQPAEQRRRLAREPALLDGVDRADAPRQARDERRQQRGHGERDEEAEQRVVLHGAREDRRARGAARPASTTRRGAALRCA